jgi:hypothetical protein
MLVINSKTYQWGGGGGGSKLKFRNFGAKAYLFSLTRSSWILLQSQINSDSNKTLY